MELSEFLVSVSEHMLHLSIVFVILLSVYYLLFRKTFVNIVDSFVVELITAVGSAVTVYVMYINHAIQSKFLISFISTELALFLGIYLVYFSSRKIRSTNGTSKGFSNSNKYFISIFCFVAALFYLTIQLISFVRVGFILFNDTEGVNHVNAYADDGILFGFVISISPLFLTALFIKRKIFGQFFWFDYLCIGVTLVSAVLSGSKSSFMVLFTAFAFVDYKFSRLYNIPKTKIPLIYVGIFFFSVIAIISITSFSGNGSTPFLGLFERILFSGDVYLLGYNDGAVKYVTQDKTLISYVFYPLYGKFAHLLGMGHPPVGVGVGLYDYTYGITTSGSTARHNYLAYIFLGQYWGWILSLLIGLFIGFVRFFLFEMSNSKSVFFLIFICTLTAIVPTCITDIYLFNYLLFMILLEFIMIVFFTLFIYLVIHEAPVAVINKV